VKLTTNVELWVCGQNIADVEQGCVWEIQGVFSTQEKAIKACKNLRFFVAPLYLDKELPQKTTEWPECVYPLAPSP